MNRALDAFMPAWRMRQVDRLRVRAAPDAAWAVVRALDPSSSALSRFLFALRELPRRFAWRRSSLRPEPPVRGIDGFTGPGKPFQILHERPGSEIVVGSVGKFWKPDIEWAPFTPETFADFRRAGYGKLAWSLEVDPDGHGGSWITWDLRVSAPDEATWRAFRRYWLLIGPFSHRLRRAALADFREKLGGSPSEEELRLPGDGLVPRPRFQKTMSATIEAPPQAVWPWLAQMGCRRAGWYSIDRLDNGGRPSADRVIPGLQSIEVGQVLPWKPDGEDGFTVLESRPGETLILGTPALLRGPHREGALDDTWTFALEPIGGGATRLLTRVRADYPSGWRTSLLTSWLRAAHRIMEGAQLRNLKRRVERAERPGLPLSERRLSG